jgi:hypothetical protein
MQGFRFVSFAAGTGFALLLAIEAAHAQEPLRIDVTLKNHRFSPSEIRVLAGKPAVINLHNADPTAEEFDSEALGGRSGLVRLHSLAPGRYPFMGESHSDTAHGVVIAE